MSNNWLKVLILEKPLTQIVYKNKMVKKFEEKEVKKKVKKKNPLDEYLDELEKYDDGVESPSPIHSSGH